eukprot:GFUD01015764.1.p1 GENE.GFUD01015764.1~~GFUD01015764.1.p1  ORF type:complete len:698 (+),score=94.25 GFUD01015764.1:142-2235(+)
MELGAIPKNKTNKDQNKLQRDSTIDEPPLEETVESLPDEILEHIFALISPYGDLESCASVCARWNACCRRVIAFKHQNFHNQILKASLLWSHQPIEDTVNSISKRYSHCAVYYPERSSMYIFGGCTSTSSTFNDLWELNLSTRSWRRPLSMGAYPSPKACASMVLHEDMLILFGGWTHPSLYPLHQSWKLFSELHIYYIKENRWAFISAEPAERPPAMAGHSATVHRGTMVVFGGLHKQRSIGHYTSSNDIWTYDLCGHVWEMQLTGGENSPLPRYGQSQIFIDDEHLLILGGCGGPNNEYTDIWLLKMDTTPWTWVQMEVHGGDNRAKDIWCHPACRVGDKVVVLGKNRSNVSKQPQPQQQQPTQSSSQAWNVIPQLRRGLNRGQGAIRRGSAPAPHHRQARDVSSSDSDMDLAVDPVPSTSRQEHRLGGSQEGARSMDDDDEPPRLCAFRVNNLSPRLPGPNQGTFRTTLNVNIGSAPLGPRGEPIRSSLPPSNPVNAPNALIPVKVSPSHSKSFGPAANTGNQDPSIAGPRAQAIPLNEKPLPGAPGNPETTRQASGYQKNRQKMLENRQRQLASLQKMEEKIRNNSRSTQSPPKNSGTSAPVVCPHHRMTTYILDISNCKTEHYVTWLPLPPGSSIRAPQESILYSLVLGRTELIMFGGLQKDVSLGTVRGQQNNSETVSNCLYYLNPPQLVI